MKSDNAYMQLCELASLHECCVFLWVKHFGKSIIFAHTSKYQHGTLVVVSFEQIFDELDLSSAKIVEEVDVSHCKTWEEVVVKVDLENIQWDESMHLKDKCMQC